MAEKTIADREGFRKALYALVDEQADSLWESLVEQPGEEAFDTRLRRDAGAWFRRIAGLALSVRGQASRIGSEVRCRSCGQVAEFKQHRSYTLETVLAGKWVRVRAAYYACACGRGNAPLLGQLGVEGDGMTPALRELVVLAGTVETYETASRDLLGKMAEVELSDVQVRRACVAEASGASEFLSEPGTVLSPCTEVVVGIDGGMVHVDGRWQEAKLGCLYRPGDRVALSPKRAELLSREVIGVLGDPDALASKLWPRVVAMGASDALAIVLRDGAPWIHNLVAELFPRRVEILDWHHASEHVHECARVLYGHSRQGHLSPKARTWCDAQLERLWDDRVLEVLEGLRFLGVRQKSTAKREAIEALTGYFTDNLEAMRYRTFRERGYPIGSGFIESANHHVVQVRMKRPGCRWDRTGAESILVLRCLYRSTGRWNEYWATRRKAA